MHTAPSGAGPAHGTRCATGHVPTRDGAAAYMVKLACGGVGCRKILDEASRWRRAASDQGTTWMAPNIEVGWALHW